ncbi:MAG: HAD-IB family hydrolase [Acidobacteriota bacterium]|nr:HAD-IB family hydrolase [Acidobacteriota bacterium]
MPSHTVAAFDLDGTLTEGGSVFAWLRFIGGDATVARAALPLLVPLTIGAVRSGHWADSAKERLFQAVLAGRDLAEVTRASRDFIVEHLREEGRHEVLARLRWHLEHGHDVVIVSASPQIYVDILAEELGIAGGLGTRLAVDDRGRLTGSYLGKNCRGTEKMRRLNEWITARGYDEEPVIYAYGNSRGDRRLLAGATHPFDAGKMGRWGALRAYPRLAEEIRATPEDR